MKKEFTIRWIFIILIFFGCNGNSPLELNEKIEDWYSKMKNEIIENSEKKSDSVSYSQEKNLLYITHYNSGKKTFQEYRSLDTSQVFVRKRFGQNENFEIRSEVYENGVLATEGLVYKNSYYGPWTIRNKDGSIMYRGYRYEKHDFGKWIYYWEDGILDSIVNEKNDFFTDSILNKIELKTTLIRE